MAAFPASLGRAAFESLTALRHAPYAAAVHWLFASKPARRLAAASALACGAWALSGCEDPPPPPFEVVVRVESDVNKALPNVPVFGGGKQRGVTGPDGSYKLKLGGADGDAIDLKVECPPGTRSDPSNATKLVIRRLEGGKATEYPTFCRPAHRLVVLGMRVENGANLPIKYLDKVVARTDAAGAAHFALVAAPGDDVRLVVDTSEAPMLKPASPELHFRVVDTDTVTALETRFAVEKKAKPTVYAAPKGPTRIH
jgi:hypothetical protein